jgi:hypothetical protein
MTENVSVYAPQEIDLLKVWKSKAAGWRWLHYKSMSLYKKINSNFTYASIILSTIAGAGGFSTAGAQTKNEMEMALGYVFGAINVIIGLINSVQRFGKPAEKTELHASAAMQYAMLYRLLETEISLSDKHRRSDLISTVRTEMDRLLAQSPMIPQKIVDAYNAEFPETINKPDICNGMVGEKKFNDSQPETPSLSTRISNLMIRTTNIPAKSDSEIVDAIVDGIVGEVTHPRSVPKNTAESQSTAGRDTLV